MEPAELISAIRAGSREAFDEMCGRYYAPLTAYARLFLNGNWAQDVVQDARPGAVALRVPAPLGL